jgi:hypothetical protein
MKSRLNITVEDDLMNKAKRYASRHHISLSQLVERYFKSITRQVRGKNVIQIVDQLPKAHIEENTNLKEAYFEDQRKKHGF